MAKRRQVTEVTPTAASVVDSPKHVVITPRREVTKSTEFVSIYTNDVQIQTSSWDLRFIFAESGPLSAEEPATTISVKQLGEVRMSPQLAKRMAVILIEQLTVYEDQFGQIPGPKDELSAPRVLP
jgi:hypothetical protein